MRFALVFLAACWSQDAKPAPVVHAPPAVVGPPPGAKVITADPVELGEINSADTELDAPPPWSNVGAGWVEHTYNLGFTVGGKSYRFELAGGVDGALLPLFVARDVLPGKPVELVLVVEHNTDGGKQVSVVVCGIGASGAPSCGSEFIGMGFDLNDVIDVTTPKSGGVVAAYEGKREKLWFTFP